MYALSIEYAILLFIAANGTRAWMQTARHNAENLTNEATA
ncbi:aminotransferase [Vibrio cholerae]|nr:aminotransferase [Vibrio cholerae]